MGVSSWAQQQRVVNQVKGRQNVQLSLLVSEMKALTQNQKVGQKKLKKKKKNLLTRMNKRWHILKYVNFAY